MKKILLTLSILSFICSCSNDDNKEEYLNNNRIEGTWYSIQGKDSLIYTFKDNVMSSELYAHISGEDQLKYEGKDNYGNYLLTDTLIILTQNNPRWEYVYKLSYNNDSLYMKQTINVPEFWTALRKVK